MRARSLIPARGAAEVVILVGAVFGGRSLDIERASAGPRPRRHALRDPDDRGAGQHSRAGRVHRGRPEASGIDVAGDDARIFGTGPQLFSGDVTKA